MKRITDANEFDVNVCWDNSGAGIEVEYDHEVVEDTDSDIILPRDFENWENEAKRTIGKIKSNHTKEK